jgi:virulence factor Mce-like protein
MSRRRRSLGRERIWLGVVGFLVCAAVVYGIFAKRLPWSHPYSLDAIVQTSNQLAIGSPVRVAGVDVGKVAGTRRGPGHTTIVRMNLPGEGGDIHRDATLRIRPRLFLEGGFYVDLDAGSPGAPALGGGGTIPLGQTAGPVQLNDVLDALDAPTRDNLKHVVATFSSALSHGGAQGTNRSFRALAPAALHAAQLTQASLGTNAHDVSNLIEGLSRTTAALGAADNQLGRFVDGFAHTAAILASQDTALGATVRDADALLRDAPPALGAVERALPPTAKLADRLLPALHLAPAGLRAALALLDQVGAITQPAQLPRLLSRLGPAVQGLPGAERKLIPLFTRVTPVGDCTRNRVVPTLRAKIDDGALSTGLPVWKELIQSGIGLASASGSFDANGSYIRYLSSVGPDTLNVEKIPGAGVIVSSAVPTALSVRPQLLPGTQQTPLRPDAACSQQPAPNLASPDTKIHTFDDAQPVALKLAPSGLRGLAQRLQNVLKGGAR